MESNDRIASAEACEAVRAERERITRVYKGYYQSEAITRAWEDGPAARYMRETKWRALGSLVGTAPGWNSRSWVIDLGAGRRSELVDPTIGARPVLASVLAVDLMVHCAQALARQSGVHSVLGHAALLPIATGSVMVVYQSLMLSSVLDAVLRSRIYAEITRVVAPGGLFVSYDTRYTNPWNPHTRPVVLRELKVGFAGWRQRHCTLTGLPPILRWLAPASRALCRAVEAIPVLRSHRLFVAEKPGAPS